MKRYLPFLVLALIFLFIKIGGIGVRLSDSNIYFYTAYQLLHGHILYKDIFFTNFPLIPYISALYFLILGGNLSLYTFTATIEVIIVSGIIYHLVLKKNVGILVATLASSVYLFSFIVLVTSDHQSGVFLASVFAVISYAFFETKQFGRSGIFIALSLMTKAYFLPIFLALLIAIFFIRRTKSIPFVLACGLTGILIVLPSLVFAREEIFNNIIEYSLARSQGISKLNILRFFAIHDILLVILFFYSLVRIKKNLFMGVLSLTSLLFIILYKDIYYLYLNFLIPFLALTFSDVYVSIQKRFKPQRLIIPTILFIIFTINTVMYLSSYQNLQKLSDIDTIAMFLKHQPNTVLYGTNDITPALAYLSDKQLLNGIIDTNENIFRKGFLNASLLTKDAIKQEAIIVSHGAYYPQFNVEDPLMGGIFDREQITKSCEIIASYPITTEGIENRLNFLSCRVSLDE